MAPSEQSFADSFHRILPFQRHFGPICDNSGGTLVRAWRVPGAGKPKGFGPYHVCVRLMPLPLPNGWNRSF